MSRTPLMVCHVCRRELGAAPCAGPCPCPRDGRDVRDHAREYACPLGKFPSRGLGDTVGKVLDATGVGPVAKAVIEKVTGKPCRCGERRDALNQAAPYRGIGR